MSAFTDPRLLSFEAGAAIVKFRFVKFNSADDTVIQSSAVTDAHLGIAMCDADAAGDTVEVALPGGGAKLELSATIARGVVVASTTGGLGKTPASSDTVGAQLHESGVSGDIVGVHVISPTIF